MTAGDQDPLRQALHEISNQLCLAVDGRVDFTIRTQFTDPDIEQLVLLTNFLLDSVARLLNREQANARDLDQRVAERSALLKATWDTLLDGLIVIDAQGTILEANPAAKQLLATDDSLIGRNIKAFMPEPYSREHDDYLLRYLQTGEQRVIGVGREVEVRRRDGTQIPVRLAVSEICVHEQRRFVGLLRDIREQRAQERALEERRQAAEAASLAKSRFLASMSHELRTPLNAIIGYSELILEELDDGVPAENSRSDLQAIRDAGRHLLGLINDVLDMSRIEAGQTRVHREPIHPAELARAVGAVARPLVEGNGNRFVLELDTQLPLLETDSSKLRQCLLNLIGNAAKFTQDGVVTLRVQRVDDAVLWTVSDTGIGISPEALHRIFDAFVQAEDDIDRRFGGTGLGLALTRQLIELLGGRIEVESQLGAGSSFHLFLPLSSTDEGEGQ